MAHTDGAPGRRPPPAPRPPRSAPAAAPALRRFDPWHALALALITFGVVVRIIAYLERPPLWLDEAMVALNIGSRGLAGLARPLDWDQAAPVPFLWLTKLATLVLGVNEYGLRAVSLLAALAFLVILWRAARTLVGPRVALLAVAFAACSPLLINYGLEAKQYGLDGLVAVALLALLTAVLARPDAAAPWRWLIIGGAVGLGGSMPAVFVLAGIAASLAADRRIRAARGASRHLAIAAVAWCAVFAVLYVVAYRATTHSAYLDRFWEPSFLTPGAPDAARRLTDALYQAFAGPYVLQFGPPDREGAIMVVGTVVWAVGVGAAWWRRSIALALLLAVPIATCFAAAALGQYPIAARMMIFDAPFLFLAGALAVEAVVDLWPTAHRRLVYATGLLAFVGWRAAKSFTFATDPRTNAENPAAIADLDRTTGSDPVYLMASGVPGWLFYTTDWHAPDTARLRWYAAVASAGGPAFANAPSRPVRTAREGAGLEYRYHGRREIVGTGDGMEYRAGVKFVTPRPDSGWASVEAARVRAAAHPAASIYASHFTPPELAPLLAAIARDGGRITWSRVGPSAAGYRVRFGSAR